MKKKINILITGIGAPGTQGTIRGLLKGFNEGIVLYGTECNPQYVIFPEQEIFEAVIEIPCAYSDSFHYVTAILDVCKRANIDVIFPQNTAELQILAASKQLFLDEANTKIVVSHKNTIDKTINKAELYLSVSDLVAIPKHVIVEDRAELIKQIKQFGYPKKVVVKRLNGSGGRGIRIVHRNPHNKKLFLHEKPNAYDTNLLGIMDSIPIESNIDPLMISEYIAGTEYTVDCFRFNNKCWAVPRERIEIRNGITWHGKIKKNEKLIQNSKAMAKRLGLEYCFGFQFIVRGDTPYLLECNPRIQGTSEASLTVGLNLPYLAVKTVLDSKVPEVNLDWKNIEIFRINRLIARRKING